MSKELREEFNGLKAAALAIVAAAQTAKRGLTAEEKQENDRRFARCDEIKGILAEQKRFADSGLEQFSDAVVKAAELAGGTPPAQPGKQSAQGAPSDADNRFDAKTGKYSKGFKEAIFEYVKNGTMRQEFALISTTANGVLIPTMPAAPVVIRRMNNPYLAALASRGLVPLLTPGTETIPVPVFDDSSNVAQTPAEDSATASSQDPTSSNPFTLGAVLFDSKAIWLSNTLLDGVHYDVLGYCDPILQKRIDLKQNALWTAKLRAAAVAASINVVVAAHAAGVTYTDLLNFQVGLPPAYRSDQVFLISDSLFTAMRGLVDSVGRPLYQESLVDDQPDKLFGKPAFVDPYLDAVAANAYSGITISAECLKVRLCSNRRLTRYVNVPSQPDQFGLQLFMNGDMNFVSQGTAAFKMGAS